MPKRILSIALLFLCGLLSAESCFAQGDWSQWRGPKLDSVADGEVVVNSLDDSTKLWRAELPGPAGSSPIVVGDKVFATSIDGAELFVLCFDVTDGKELWRKQVDGKNKNARDGGNSASSSPCSDGTHVWTMFSNGQVNCFTVDGEEIWTKNLQEDYGRFQIQFGMATTPVLLDDQLIFGLMHGKMRNSRATSVGKIVSLDKKTGEEKWMHVRKTDAIAENKHVYASPSIDFAGDTPQLIIHGADYTTGHSIENGSEVWRLGGLNPKGDGYNQYLRFVASATCRDGKVIIPTAKRGPVLAVSSGPEGMLTADSLDWRSERITPDVASPIYYQDLIFLARENGTLACLDAKTGKKLVEKRYMADRHRSTPIAVDGKLIITDRSGKVILVKADESLEELSSIALGEETLASPAVSNGKIFVRTFDALYAFGKK